MAKERIDTYPEAARAIALWLDEFCDKSLRYPEMIADAARRAAKEIELLRCEASQQANAPDVRKQCRICKVGIGEYHKGYCSAGVGKFAAGD
ncbi:MAG: hypothetical protein SV375_21685 [Thermodesulfobacteriota bacterium]|nr:hypothetical protein [Thermodesulfobacteriota bacterium]